MKTLFMRPVEKFKPRVPNKELRELALLEDLSPTPTKKQKHLMKTITGEVLAFDGNKQSKTAYPDTNEHGKFRKQNSRSRVQYSNEEIDNAPSVMAEITDEILELLDREDNDGAITLTQKHLLRTVVTMIPEAERIIRISKSAKGIHNFSQLINNCREIMADIQMSRDSKFLSNGINLRVLQPGFIEITNMTVNAHSQLKQEISQYIPPEKRVLVNTAIDNCTKSIAKYFESQYREMKVKIETHLG